MTANPDVMDQLGAMIMDEKRKAYDAGALGLIDSVIQLSEMSGGRLNTRQLRDYKAYITRTLERKNSEAKAEQQETDPEVRIEPRRVDTEVVELPWLGETVGQDVPTQAEEPQAGQGSEAVTEAE